jgi:hypothetical protein
VTPLSSSAKWAVGFGLVTFGTTFALGPIFAVAQLFNGDDFRDGWLTALISMGGGCANFVLGVGCGVATVVSAMSPMRSENPRDRKAARLALALVGLAVLVLLVGQLQWRQ